MTPNAEKVSYKSFSSTSGSKFPINTFAPTSKFLVCADALFTLIGFPYNWKENFKIILVHLEFKSLDLNQTHFSKTLIIFIILMA